jgi:N6-L-threonylcarbamoyladenine synthase
MLILGIETSCDETSVALVEDGRRIIDSDVASQIKLHAAFGGVVPELASRAHIQRLIPMIEQCLVRNHIGLQDLDALAVTAGPGLVGALLVGVETAKALAFTSGKPLIPVHHIAGHLYSPFLRKDSESRFQLIVLEPENPANGGIEDSSAAGTPTTNSVTANDPEQPPVELGFPYVGLVVSGGHTSLALLTEPGGHELLGETVDDAAGEAFDKVAKLLGLGYPGGPRVEIVARNGNPTAYVLPRPMCESRHGLQFSFSGLKTAVLKLVNDLGGPDLVRNNDQMLADMCASFQAAVVDVLITKTAAAMDKTGVKNVAIVGGVACNGALRDAARKRLAPKARVVIPPPALCTDNAAMIAGLAWHLRDKTFADPLTLNAQANLALY